MGLSEQPLAVPTVQVEKAVAKCLPEAIFSYHQGMTLAAEQGIAAAWNNGSARLLVLVNADKEAKQRLEQAGFKGLHVLRTLPVKSAGGDRHYAHVFGRESNQVGRCALMGIELGALKACLSCGHAEALVTARCVLPSLLAGGQGQGSARAQGQHHCAHPS